MTRPPAWTLADVLDFEHFLATLPGQHDPDGLDSKAISALGGIAGRSRRQVFRAWLDLRRLHAGGATPGQAWQGGEALMSGVAWVFGGLLGAGLAGVWLAQAGEAPVNAPLFWVATVGLQMLLLVLGLAGWLLRRRAGGLLALLGQLINRAGSLLRHLPGERRQALQAAQASLARQGSQAARLLAAPALALAQRFGVAFNIGLLLSMLALHLPLVDLRFGWQSSYPVEAAQVHRVVQAVATPWRWALPQGLPSAAEVAATRVSQGQRAAELPAEAARAWWPFLALSVLCWGLLPRLALLVLAWHFQQRALAALRFDDAPANALWRRLGGARLMVAGGDARLPDTEEPARATAPSAGACVVLAARDTVVDEAALAEVMAQRMGWQLEGLHAVPVDDRLALAPWLAELSVLRPRPVAWAVLMGAERDPIVALGQGLRAVRNAAPPGVEVLVLLSPDAAAVADPALREERLTLWRRFMQIQRLDLAVEPLW